MKQKRIPKCPDCNAEINHLLINYNRYFTFNVKSMVDDKLDWDDCKKEIGICNMGFCCPECEKEICRDDPEMMVKFLLGEKVSFDDEEFC